MNKTTKTTLYTGLLIAGAVLYGASKVGAEPIKQNAYNSKNFLELAQKYKDENGMIFNITEDNMNAYRDLGCEFRFKSETRQLEVVLKDKGQYEVIDKGLPLSQEQYVNAQSIEDKLNTPTLTGSKKTPPIGGQQETPGEKRNFFKKARDQAKYQAEKFIDQAKYHAHNNREALIALVGIALDETLNKHKDRNHAENYFVSGSQAVMIQKMLTGEITEAQALGGILLYEKGFPNEGGSVTGTGSQSIDPEPGFYSSPGTPSDANF
tara:strand:+ start:334 stop:1128 length:795 start_codon:yes stop_codon:yes gene_type:complete